MLQTKKKTIAFKGITEVAREAWNGWLLGSKGQERGQDQMLPMPQLQ